MEQDKACKDRGCAISREGPSLELLSHTTGFSCRSVQELSILFAISQMLERSFDLTDIVKPLLRRLQDFMGLGRGLITLIDQKDGRILLSEAIGIPRDVKASDYLNIVLNPLEETIREGTPKVITDLQKWASQDGVDKKLLEELCLTKGIGLLCVPLKAEESVIGTLSIERQRDTTVGWEADIRLLTMISSIIAQAARVRQDASEQIEALREENERLQEQIAHEFRPKDMIGTSSEMRNVYLHIEQVASSTTTVLIRGESGTGKELVAKALHEQSNRKGKPFVKFNCAALPDSIIESELFGHEKGAFTGALSMRKGRFEVAHGGTIFLDEIGDISLSTQIKLLRVLQEREFERVGSQQTLQTDVRVIAATSRNLEDMMEKETLREDLYYRLNVFPIYMPPLRSRKSDLLLLADHFIGKYAIRMKQKPVRISSAAIDMLASYHWPGNVRELENCIERAVLLSKGQAIRAHHLPPTLQSKTPKEKKNMPTMEEAIQALEREMIIDVLKDTSSNMAEAARRLGMTERKMGLRVKKYAINLDLFKK